MKFSKTAYEILARLICDEDRKYLYRTRNELERLFYGNCNDLYNIPNDLNRKDYTVYCLMNIIDIEKIFTEITDYRIFKENGKETAKNLVAEINDVLMIENYQLKPQNNGLYKLEQANKHSIVKSELHKDITVLSSEYISEHLTKMEKKIKDKDFSGAITNSKSLIEQIIRDLCNKLEVEFIDNDLGKAFKNIQIKMNLNPKNYELDGFKKILNGLVNIVTGIAEIRNKASDSHSTIYEPLEHHAVLCVNASITFSNFIFSSYIYQKEKRIL